MGGLFHFLDFNHHGKSRKTMKLKRCNHGTEAPKNIMEFPSDTLHGHQQINEAIMEKCPSKLNLSSSAIPRKKSTNDEMTKQVYSRQSEPSVVARLMGMDALPSETKSSSNSKGKTRNTLRNDEPRRRHSRNYSGQYETGHTLLLRTKRDEPSLVTNTNSTTSKQESKSIRPKPREHPQEEILQNFKKDFEAWQANKMWEQTAVGSNGGLKPAREKQDSILEGTFKKEMNVRCADANKKPTSYNSAAILSERNEETGSRNGGSMCKAFKSNPMETNTFKSGTGPVKSEYFKKPNEKNQSSSSPTRIVVLKPGDENIGDTDDIWPSSAANAGQKELSIEDFLKEVRNRLKMEINGKSRSNMTRGGTTDFYSTERPTGPRQAAQNMAKQIRESVTKDFCASLNRSEATGFYKSEIQHSESDSSEFTSGDKGTHLTERLNDTLGNEEATASHFSCPSSRTELSTKDGSKSRSFADATMIEEKLVCWGDNPSSLADKTRSFRVGEESDKKISEDASPRNLARSLSAPLSGRTSGELTSEAKHALEGAHVQRKHEVTEKSLTGSKKNRKDHLDFKGRVSSLRHNLTFKGKLFGKKVHLIDKEDANEPECAKDIETIPSCDANMAIRQTRLENLTEVPPSPDWSSGSSDDFCKPGHPSPVSPLDMPFIEGSQSPQIYKNILFCFPQTSESAEIRCEISQSSTEIRCEIPPTSEKISSDIPKSPEKISYAIPALTKEKRCASGDLNSPEVELSEEVKVDAKIYQDEIGHEGAYVRDILITAGLYETLSSQDAFLRWGELTQILPEWVFEKVEQAFRDKHEKKGNDAYIVTYEVPRVDRKLLFGLVNEALQFIARPFLNSLITKRCPLVTIIPHGQMLFVDVLSQIQKLTCLPDEEEDCSLESVSANDVNKAPWIPMMHEGTCGVGNELELLILRDLVEEFVLDIYRD